MGQCHERLSRYAESRDHGNDIRSIGRLHGADRMASVAVKHAGKKFEEIEDDIALDYEKARPEEALPWDHARPAVKAAWDKLAGVIGPRDVDRGVRSGF